MIYVYMAIYGYSHVLALSLSLTHMCLVRLESEAGLHPWPLSGARRALGPLASEVPVGAFASF